MRIIAGLGNPGPQYETTRHNVGFLVVDALADAHGLVFGPRKFDALTARGRVAGEEVLLAKPLTYMNLCGRSLAPLAAFHKVAPSDLLVVHDDLDLELGRIQLRERGGDGGHNGLRSIIAELGTRDFARLRVGIGRPRPPEGAPPGAAAAARRGQVVDYVLSPFTDEELPILERVIARAVEAIESVLRDGIARAMNRFNQLLAPDEVRGLTATRRRTT
ncbi:MAG TPA: aminoacyl-tRNA hydrolase [Thermodesulfobacteriota bacterium]